MRTCASCGEESPPHARFCLACGTPFEAAPPPAESRKVVSMVFCDIEGSTALGGSMDPEALTRVLERWVSAMRLAIERHEGTFVEFRGDSILGVFGIPVLHEDDAVRAVRAAVDMREALADLNRGLSADMDLTLAVRTGVNTGEVLIGPQAGTGLVVGDPVNVAARLEQAATGGEILVGDDTARLVREQVSLEAIPPLTVKGKEEPLAAFRVLGVGASPRERPGCLIDAPMVGRVDELTRLGLWVDRIRHERGCRGALLSGDAGLGKTRLAEEFLRRVADGAAIGRGVCHAYGESALAPAADVVRSLLGLREDDDPATARASIEAALGSTESSYTDHVLQMLHLADGDAPLEELFASTRRLISACGRDRLVVVFFDDIHWASPPLVELIEHLLRWLRDAPVLVVCTARMEFVESHPTWAGDRDLGVLHVALAPLSGVETDVLAGSLLGNDALPPAVLDRVSEAAEGNPLFLEQLLAMLMDDGLLVEEDGRWVLADHMAELPVPPSIHALLAARLDRLGADERSTIEHGAVVGRTFTWQAVEALSEPASRAGVGGHLMGLVRRDLIRSDRSELAGQDAFSFHHVLIRDTTYGAIPKGRRAELHERFARWLEASSVAGDLDETIGYHMERACLLRRDLGVHDARTRDLGDRSADLLAGVGRRAARRGQDASAVDLLGRALRLIGSDDARRPGISLDLAQAEYGAGAFAEAESHARALLETDRPDPKLATAASVLVANVRFQLDPDLVLDDMRGQAYELLSAAEAADDRLSQAMAHRLLARVHLWAADTQAMTDAAEAAYRCAAEAGDDRELAECTVVLCWALNLGPEWLPSVAERLGELAEAMSGNRRVQAIIWAHLAPTLALLGHPDEGKERRLGALSQLRDLGLEVQAAIATQSSGGSILAGLAAGRAHEAYDDVRWAYDVLTRAEERGFLASVTGMLAEAAFDMGSLDEAEALVEQVRGLATDDDADAQQRWRMVGAKIAAARGRVEEARHLLAVIEAQPPSYPAWSGFAAADRAEIRARIGDAASARVELDEAVRCFADKGVAAGPRIAQVEALIGGST